MRAYFLACSTLVLSACATIVNTKGQDIFVQMLSSSGELVTSANCEISTASGLLRFKAGQSINIPRSNQDLTVSCTDVGHMRAEGRLISSATIGMAGNLVFGGVVGLLVDHSGGSGYSYPTHIRLRAGQLREYDSSSTIRARFSDGRRRYGSDPEVQKIKPLLAGTSFQLVEVDQVSGSALGRSTFVISSAASDRFDFNGGSFVVDKAGAVISGSLPSPNLVGLGGNRLRPGYVGKAIFSPGGEVPPVTLDVRVVEAALFAISGNSVLLYVCEVNGHGMPFGQAGSGMSRQLITGTVVVEPQSGLLVGAQIASASPYYSFARDFIIDDPVNPR